MTDYYTKGNYNESFGSVYVFKKPYQASKYWTFNSTRALVDPDNTVYVSFDLPQQNDTIVPADNYSCEMERFDTTSGEQFYSRFCSMCGSIMYHEEANKLTVICAYGK